MGEPDRWGTTFTLIQCWAYDPDGGRGSGRARLSSVDGARAARRADPRCGSGSHVVDADGRRYLDFSSQLVFTNLGHQHPHRRRDQAASRSLCTLAPAHASDVRGEAARMIVEVAPDRLGHVLFTTGGTEAIEHAVRMARVHSGRPKVLAAYRSYHGSTTTSIHLTGDPRRWASDTGAAGAVHFFGPFLYRSAFGSTTPEEECGRRSHLEQVILLEGPSTIAALVLESVTGGSGSSCPRPATCAECGSPSTSWHRLHRRRGTRRLRPHWCLVRNRPRRRRPRPHGFRERRQPGMCRSAAYWSAIRCTRPFTQRPYPVGLTYSEHPLACAAAVGAIQAMHDEGTVAGSLASRRGHPRARAREACRDPPLRGGRSWHRRTVGTRAGS